MTSIFCASRLRTTASPLARPSLSASRYRTSSRTQRAITASSSAAVGGRPITSAKLTDSRAWSRRLARFCGRYPVFLDACAEVAKRRGPGFLAEWATVMTGAKPKRYFLRPGLALPIALEAGRQMWRGNGRKNGQLQEVAS